MIRSYPAELVRVIDGDTVVLNIDLGFHVHTIQTCRLQGIDTPEVRGPERVRGLAAAGYLARAITDRKFDIKTHKDKQGKYGRYLVEIFAPDNINQRLVKNGFATKYGEGR